MPTMVKCRYCGTIHRSGIQMGTTREQFLRMAPNSVLDNNSENCPKCGKISTYSGTDYFWEDN